MHCTCCATCADVQVRTGGVRMAWDFRLQADFFNHPKTIKLLRLHGAEGVVALQRLWCFATEYRPSGVLIDMDREDIAAACHIDLESIGFIDELVKMRWLDVLPDGRTYAIHNWEKRQPNVVNRDKISAQKKAAANVRHEKNRQKKARQESRKAKKEQAVNDGSAGARAPAMQEQCPNPTQPNHKNKDSLSPLSHDQGPNEGERVREIFFSLIRESQPKTALRYPDAWARTLQGFLDVGQSADDLVAVMQWAMRDSFWRSRILSPKAFADNYAKVSLQMAEVGEKQDVCYATVQNQGMSAEEWEEVKNKRSIQLNRCTSEVNAMPP